MVPIHMLTIACTISAAAAFTSVNTRTTPRSHSSSCPALPSTFRTDTVNINEIAVRDIDTFQTWTNSVGIQKAPGVVLKGSDRFLKNVQMVASQDVAQGSPVLYVPEELIMSSSKAMAAYRSRVMEGAEKQLEITDAMSELKQFYLMIQLLVEIERGTDSPWYPWLNSLPRYFENAVSMTSFCVNCLPPLLRNLNEQERGNQQCLSELAFAKVPYLSEETKADGDLLKWAYQIVYTRAFEYEDDLRLVPMGDYFDHTSCGAPEVAPWYDEYGNYYAYSQYDIPAGSPLRMTYGHETRPSFLLARYGFLDEDGEATHCKLLFDKRDVDDDLLALGYAEERMLFWNTGEVSEEVWDVLLYRHLDETGNTADKQTLMNAHRSGDYDTKNALHQAYYPFTSNALMEHIDSFLETLDKLIKKSETIGMNEIYVKNEHPRLPLIMRHNNFVKNAFLQVKGMYSPNQNWRDATLRVLECNIEECAEAICVLDENGEYQCEGGLGYNEDGSERATSRTIMNE